jgi:transposase
VATLAVTGRADLTDAQWAVLEPVLPRGKKPGRRRSGRNGSVVIPGCGHYCLEEAPEEIVAALTMFPAPHRGGI